MAFTMRLGAGVLLSIVLLVLLSLLNGRGEDLEQALAAYVRYLPGNAVPWEVDCHMLSGEYPGAYGELCQLETVPHCQRGYLVAREGAITYTRFIGCDFPAAYLMARYGRPERITYYRRVVMLVWEGMSAQLRHTGRFNAMQRVTSVGWW